jgi:hypothetical protein
VSNGPTIRACTTVARSSSMTGKMSGSGDARMALRSRRMRLRHSRLGFRFARLVGCKGSHAAAGMRSKDADAPPPPPPDPEGGAGGGAGGGSDAIENLFTLQVLRALLFMCQVLGRIGRLQLESSYLLKLFMQTTSFDFFYVSTICLRPR